MKRCLAIVVSAAVILVSVIAGLASGAGPAQISAVPSPLAKTGVRYNYRIRNVDPLAKDDPADGRFWRISEYTVWEEPGVYEGRAARALHREDRSPKGDRVLWEITASPELYPYRAGRKVITRQGKMVEDQTEILANHFYRFPPRTIHGAAISWALERADLTIGKRTDYWFTLGTENEPWQMFFIPEAEETVNVPAGTFRCVRVKVELSADKLPGFLKMLPKIVIRQIISPSYAWVTKDTHTLIKYQGKLEGPSAPERVQELVSVR